MPICERCGRETSSRHSGRVQGKFLCLDCQLQQDKEQAQWSTEVIREFLLWAGFAAVPVLFILTILVLCRVLAWWTVIPAGALTLPVIWRFLWPLCQRSGNETDTSVLGRDQTPNVDEGRRIDMERDAAAQARGFENYGQMMEELRRREKAPPAQLPGIGQKLAPFPELGSPPSPDDNQPSAADEAKEAG